MFLNKTNPTFLKRLNFLNLNSQVLKKAYKTTNGTKFIKRWPYTDKIIEWIDKSQGRVRADVAHRKLAAMGYQGAERTTRRVVAALKDDPDGNVHLFWPHRARLIWPHLEGCW